LKGTLQVSTKNKSFFLIPEIWFCIGYLVFWVGNIPLIGLYNTEYLVSNGHKVARISTILLIVFSLCVSVSFLLQGVKGKKMLPMEEDFSGG